MGVTMELILWFYKPCTNSPSGNHKTDCSHIRLLAGTIFTPNSWITTVLTRAFSYVNFILPPLKIIYLSYHYLDGFGATVYDGSVTHPTSLPTTSLDFLFPQWKDKLILTYPNDDDSILFLFDSIIKKYGFEYIYSLQAQNPLWVRGTATPALLISPAYNNGTNTNSSHAITFTANSGFAQGVSQKESTDVSISWPQAGAIFSTTKVPESAKLLLGYLMDDEWQQLTTGGRFATRRTYDKLGVFNQSGIDPLAFGRFVSDRERVEALRLEIEAVIGPPQGMNPAEQY